MPLLSVDADAVVTYDIKKLIRVPNTIHGETGFIAMKIVDINKFNPLKDALITTNKYISIKFIEQIPKLVIGGTTLSFSKGEKNELPLAIALFFLLKKSAILIKH